MSATPTSRHWRTVMAETPTVIERTRSALQKIDESGHRGLTMVTYREIEAMALTIVAQAEALDQLIAARADSTKGDGNDG